MENTNNKQNQEIVKFFFNKGVKKGFENNDLNNLINSIDNKIKVNLK